MIVGAGLAPAEAAISAVWGWIDQKKEAHGLLGAALDKVSDRILDTGLLKRHELVVAAHTALAMSAFFEVIAESPIGTALTEAGISDREKLLLAGAPLDIVDHTIQSLYRLEVPIPSAVTPFAQNRENIAAWATLMAEDVSRFVHSVLYDELYDEDSDDDVNPEQQLRESKQFGTQAQQRVGAATEALYRSSYLDFAAKVPEFKIWADLVEHAGTQSALARMEQLLSATVKELPAHRDLAAIVRRLDQATLRGPVLDAATDGYGTGVTFPSLEELFVDPRCKSISFGKGGSPIGDDTFWQINVSETGDLGTVLARHFSSARATTQPLLLLGHPGAGKSLVTKVLAARLPDWGFPTVRVPLRHVEANATIAVQIQQALDASTHNRVSWHDLVEQTADRIRVVLLDGLDELLQAGTGQHADYLHQVVEFQRTEAALDRPVAVVVTSRTLVVDRLSLPSGIPLIRLEEFDTNRIKEWVRRWNLAQADPASPTMPVNFALRYFKLAAQPLLLLLLTLYRTTHEHTQKTVELSSARLYENLITDYARREVSKKSSRRLDGGEYDSAVETQIRTLAIAAFGMFNRGRQDITEADLTVDLQSLEEPQTAPTGERVLGEFFFIHTPEAREVSSIRRSYEFLHATFGEYLVARHIVDELHEAAHSAFSGRRRQEPRADMLLALLSHQPLAIQTPILRFLDDRLETLDQREIETIRDTLDLLLRNHRRRGMTHAYTKYAPQEPDTLRTLTCYVANLVLLRIRRAFGRTGVATKTLFPGSDPMDTWRSVVDLWRAGLDEQGYHAMLTAVDLVDGEHVAREGLRGSVTRLQHLHHARLRGDHALVSQLRLAHIVGGNSVYIVQRGSPATRMREWVDYFRAWTAAAWGEPDGIPPLALALPPKLPSGTPAPTSESDVLRRTASLLIAFSGEVSHQHAPALTSWLNELRAHALTWRDADLARQLHRAADIATARTQGTAEPGDRPQDRSTAWETILAVHCHKIEDNGESEPVFEGIPVLPGITR
ncbi:hypothetical protein ADK67_04895 [Saccharothrix sp. NRRL B-16348]|nr:hypothetical protein ADK67_04895 [Saccharothrix sp. NRRL B-16348]